MLTPEEQRRINQAAAAVRAVENGCPGLGGDAMRAVTAFRDVLDIYTANVGPHSRPLQPVALQAVPS
jgi:hypothetical protein